uniref:Uncharacterized protein n=1 Tax=Anguilla anguilla TaxID=7936 RepID=A0A0E9PF78_ANGAN
MKIQVKARTVSFNVCHTKSLFLASHRPNVSLI